MLQRILFAITLLALVSCGGEQNQSQTQSTDLAETSAPAAPDTSGMTEAEIASAVEQATFTDLEGNTVSLSEFKGKVVLIDFWETWCKPCLASFKTMQQLVENYPDRFVVLAVTPGFTNSVEDAQEFAKNHDYDFVWLYDENKLHQKLNVIGIPYKVYVGPGGNYLKRSLGSNGPKADYEQAKTLIEENT